LSARGGSPSHWLPADGFEMPITHRTLDPCLARRRHEVGLAP
jgi:hypothetical protein